MFQIDENIDERLFRNVNNNVTSRYVIVTPKYL